MRFWMNRVLPEDALVIPIRESVSVAIINMPYDLRKAEADKIMRIILAVTEATPPTPASDKE